MKFKIGDKVIGNIRARFYGVTCTGYTGVVTKINKKGRMELDNTWSDLHPDFFDLYYELEERE